jgi:hypothetical protein
VTETFSDNGNRRFTLIVIGNRAALRVQLHDGSVIADECCGDDEHP